MAIDTIKKANAEKAWELVSKIKSFHQMDFKDIEVFNNFDKLGEDTRSMVIFLFGVGNDPRLIFDYQEKEMFAEIIKLADNFVASVVDGQVRFMFGFMDVLYEENGTSLS